jgi:hypothetical protein
MRVEGFRRLGIVVVAIAEVAVLFPACWLLFVWVKDGDGPWRDYQPPIIEQLAPYLIAAVALPVVAVIIWQVGAWVARGFKA